LKVVDVITGLRADEEDEYRGLDLALHEEKGYDL
jgi:Amt family ammonium transporter